MALRSSGTDAQFLRNMHINATVYVDGIKSSTIFDVYVYYVDGREEMQEIKYFDELHSDNKKGERDRLQIKRQELWCTQNNIGYSIRTFNESQNTA